MSENHFGSYLYEVQTHMYLRLNFASRTNRLTFYLQCVCVCLEGLSKARLIEPLGSKHDST